MKKYILICASVAGLIALQSCSDEKKQEKTDDRPVVKVMTVHEREVEQKATYTATVEAENINNITSSVPARIKQILVDEGMRVAKGQKLVILDDVNTTTYELQVQNAKANLKNLETDYNRVLELYKIGGGTKQSVDQMEVQLINARNALASAERTLRNVLENTVLTSPINGTVTARNYDPGDVPAQLPILTVAQVNPVKIVINVSESELSNVHKGMPAEIRFDTYGDELFKGTVTMVSPTIDTASRTFGVEITVPNPDSRILPGMFGRVTMEFGRSKHVVVPDKAVVKQPGSGNHYVYVYSDGKVSYNQVQLGQRVADSYELLSGVDAGSEVVISGQAKLANGMEVQLAK